MFGKGSHSQLNGAVEPSSVLSTSIPEGRKWPARLKEFSMELRRSRNKHSRDEARGNVWKILNSAICLYVRFHAARLGQVTREDREDLAAEKSLYLLRRIESGKTDFSEYSPAEIASFLSKVTRNELLDLLRKQTGRVEPIEDDRPEYDVRGTNQGSMISAIAAPDVPVECKEFSEVLRRCVDLLDSLSRLVWFFRVFYEMASKDIAVHPKVRVKVGHVDVLLHRSRKMIRDCMRQSGFDTHEMPPGTFTELWKTFRLEEVG